MGLAAIQVAKALSAEIYATVGTQEKEDFIKLLGVEYVFDSRSLDYADQIKALIHGAGQQGKPGIDVVLNSLAGEAIDKNLSLLNPFGRFVELGKRDFYADSAMSLRAFRNNISYFGVDADQLMVEQPELAEQLLGNMMGWFTEGKLRPIPYRQFAAENIVRCISIHAAV